MDVSVRSSDPATGDAGGHAKKPHNIALGIERIGLVSLIYPALSAIVLIALCIGAALGLGRLKVDDSELPIVLCPNGRLLCNPTESDLALAIGVAGITGRAR